MSATVTQELTVERTKTYQKRTTFIRSASIEKLKMFNSFICSQHYAFLPSILLWLRTSQTMFKANMERSLTYLKTLSVVCVVREMLRRNVAFALNAEARLSVVVETKSRQLIAESKDAASVLYEQLKRPCLIVAVYLGLATITLQTLFCLLFIGLNVPPVGFFFLVGCLALLARIKYKILDKIVVDDDKTRKIVKADIKKQLDFVGKTISKVKLF